MLAKFGIFATLKNIYDSFDNTSDQGVNTKENKNFSLDAQPQWLRLLVFQSVTKLRSQG